MRRFEVGRGSGLVCAVLALCAGCVSKEQVYQDIYRNRKLAYEDWRRAREGEKAKQIVLMGENGEKAKLTIDAAVLLAVGNNKQLGAILQERQKAQGRVMESRAPRYPRLDLTGSATHLDETAMGPQNTFGLNAVLSQQIFQGGAIQAGIRAAELLAMAADEQVASAIQDVVFKTRMGYYDVLLARELVAVSEGDLELAKAHLNDMRKKKDAGVVSEYDVLRATVDVTNVEAELIERQNALHLALTSLLKTLGVSQESRVELTDNLTHRPVEADLDRAVQTAFTERPEILQAELNVRLNRELIASARSTYFPRLDASFTHTYARPDPHVPGSSDWGTAWNAALTARWAVFDGLATAGRVRQAEAEYQKAVLQLADAEEQVLLDVRQAILSLEDAEKFVKSQEQNRERAKEALRLVQAGYDAGVNTEIEKLDARQALSRSQALYYQAVYRHETARLALERAMGLLKKHGIGGAGR